MTGAALVCRTGPTRLSRSDRTFAYSAASSSPGGDGGSGDAPKVDSKLDTWTASLTQCCSSRLPVTALRRVRLCLQRHRSPALKCSDICRKRRIGLRWCLLSREKTELALEKSAVGCDLALYDDTHGARPTRRPESDGTEQCEAQGGAGEGGRVAVSVASRGCSRQRPGENSGQTAAQCGRRSKAAGAISGKRFEEMEGGVREKREEMTVSRPVGGILSGSPPR